MKHFLLLVGGALLLAGCNTVRSGGAGGTGAASESSSERVSTVSGPNIPAPHVAPGDSITRAFPTGGGGGVTSTGAH
ncbi:hypothetical protein [Pedosphaera parvula]|uniref:hypothetical protein n=1 Tax=Pedosphaera parvula TaxID=1032527 RepID=UPI000590E3C3|nr:hypothetical protein [Pedosphaera parvula]